MEIKVPERITRSNLFSAYIDMQVTHLHRKTGQPIGRLRELVMKVMQDRYKPRQIVVVKNQSYGNCRQVTTDLGNFAKWTQDYIVTPSGSIYKPSYQGRSIMSQMVIDKLAERKKVKKLQLKAAGAGDDVLAKRCWYKQASIKINCNSMPGGFASPFNIFYDKGGYNSITSSARCMIARAYTLCEQLLGGNFVWFSVEELLNHIVLLLRYRPEEEQIAKCLEKYHLRQPTQTELQNFYWETLDRYCPNTDRTPISTLLDTLSDQEIAFLYYYCNLRHIIWENEGFFRPWIERLMNVDDLEIDEHVTKDDAFKVDETVVAVVTVAFTERLGGYGQVDICTDHPEYIPKLVTYCRVTEQRLHELDELMEVFVNVPADIPMTHKKPMYSRNTTVVSDTDSVIFSAGAWNEWYRHHAPGITSESYQIASLVIYWLHHAVKYALKRYSIKFGYVPDEVGRLAMKNEFLYPVMMVYPTKKTYAGLQLIQEGVIFKKPKLDIKGQQLRGSSVCLQSLDFSASLIDKILKGSMMSKLSATELIQQIVDYEQHIAKELSSGNLEYLTLTSLNYERNYKNPDTTSVVVAWRFWESVMTAKYDHLHPPGKVYIFKAVQPTTEYFEQLQKSSPKIAKQLNKWLESGNRFPKQLIVDPVVGHTPPELTSLIDIRHVVHANLASVYLTMEQLGIALGDRKLELMFSDIYS